MSKKLQRFAVSLLTTALLATSSLSAFAASSSSLIYTWTANSPINDGQELVQNQEDAQLFAFYIYAKEQTEIKNVELFYRSNTDKNELEDVRLKFMGGDNATLGGPIDQVEGQSYFNFDDDFVVEKGLNTIVVSADIKGSDFAEEGDKFQFYLTGLEGENISTAETSNWIQRQTAKSGVHTISAPLVIEEEQLTITPGFAPADKNILSGSEENFVFAFNLQAEYGDVMVEDLTLGYSGINNEDEIAVAEIYDYAGNQLGQSYMGPDAEIEFNNLDFSVNEEQAETLIVYVDLSTAGSEQGETFQFNVEEVNATGQASGNSLTSIEGVPETTSEMFTIVSFNEADLVISLASDSPYGPQTGATNKKLAKFNIANGGPNDIQITDMDFQVVYKGGEIEFTYFSLYKDVLQFLNSAYLDPTNLLSYEFGSNDLEIEAGTTTTVTVTADSIYDLSAAEETAFLVYLDSIEFVDQKTGELYEKDVQVEGNILKF